MRAHMAHMMPCVPLVAENPRRRRGFDEFFAVGGGVVVVDAKDALDPADDAADRAADDGADRAGASVALIKAVRGAARNALRVRRGGGEDCKSRNDDRDANFARCL